MEVIKETLLNKKLNTYGSDLNDFKAQSELTVEITLSEYRELISSKATKEADIKKANDDRYTRNAENEKLKEENKKLEMELFEYRKRYGYLDEINEKEEAEVQKYE